MKEKLILCLIVKVLLFHIVFFTNLHSQNQTYTFDKLHSINGWVDEAVNDIVQDHQGFIWIATWSGLKKYDGYTIKTYNQELDGNNGLYGNKITCLFEDSKKRLWVGTNYSGLYLYDRTKDRFIQFKNKANDMNSLNANHVLALEEDYQGFIWIGTEKGLNRFDPENNAFIHYSNTKVDRKSANYKGIISIEESEDNELWIGCEVGLDRLIRGKNGEPDYFVRYYLASNKLSNEDYLKHNFINKIEPSIIEPNTLWVGTSIGLKKIKYDPNDLSKFEFQTYVNNRNVSKGLSHSFVSDLYEDVNSNQLWISTFNGINILDIEEELFSYYNFDKFSDNSLNNNVVHCFCLDRSNTLWIGTDKGINKINFSSKPFYSIRLSESKKYFDNINNITFDHKRNGFWIGSNGTGLGFIPYMDSTIRKNELKYFPIKTDLNEDLAGFISNLIITEDGDIWASTKGAGLLKIPNSENLFSSKTISNVKQFTKENSLADDYLMTVFESSDKAIWIGYWADGIARLDATNHEINHFNYSKEFKLDFKKYPIVHINETIENGNSFLWFGTRGGGLYKLKFSEMSNTLTLVKHYQLGTPKDENLSNNFINDIYKPKNVNFKNELWIATENGLNILNIETDSFTYYNETHGLKSRIVQSIEEDDNGNIWLSTNQGISCIHQNSLEGKKSAINNFDSFDGLISKLFYDKSSIKLSNGYLVFGGINGINYFLPDAIHFDTLPPQIEITDFKISHKTVPIGKLEDGRTILDRHISETQKLNLSHKDNVFSIEFAGLGSSMPQKMKYAYKLEGFNDEWVYTEAFNRIAQYTNLPYDKFKFKLKAANSDGYWSEQLELDIHISPPFWLTNFAYAIYLILFLALLYGVLRITKIRSEYIHNLQFEKLEREKLKELNNVKLRFFTNISHELRTPLTLIISPLEQFLKEKTFEKRYHKSMIRMHKNATILLNMINQVLDIRKSEAGLMKIRAKEGDIIKFTNEIILSFKALAKQRKIKLKFYSKKDRISIWFDRNQMEKVWFNLLSNAIKFTPEGGRIEVYISKSETQQNKVQLEISDTGLGISENQREQIFNRFYQVESKDKESRKGGTGIGLALTKSIIEAHHGSIKVENNTDGIGSKFIIVLPVGSNHFLEEQKVKPSDSIIELPKNIIIESENIDNKNILENELIKKPGNTRPKVLIVEDNKDIRAYLKEELEKIYQIIQAVDGEDGVKIASSELPDLILADISMPNMDGIEMCRQLKSKIETSHIPIILLTARTSLIYRIEGIENGADDYISKPFNMQLLSARIDNLINSRDKLKKKFAKNFDLSPSGIVMNPVDEELLSKLKSIIEKNIDNSNFSVEFLASTLCMSRMQLYRKLKALTGKSPNKIIREIRLKHAAKLLDTKRYNVSDVTYLVGYNDLKYFRDQFKKEFGLSPSEYMKKE